MSAPLVLWLPKPPDNANSREHWAVANRKKKAYWDQIRRRVQVQLIPPPPPAPFERAEVRVEWHYPDGRWHLDEDNAVRRLKPAFDWLVSNGYLAGDTPDHLRRPPIEIRVREPVPPLSTVRLTITPLPAAA